MNNVLIFSDLHLHNHKKNINRLHDCLKVLDWIFNKAVENSCTDILFLGDLFHERSKIDILNYLRTFEMFMQFFSDHPEINIHLLVGNHDMYHKERWDVNSVKPLVAIPNVHIVDKPQTKVIHGVNVDFLPYVENTPEALKQIKNNRNSQDFHLLLGHLAVHGATLNTVYATTADVIVEYDDVMQFVDPSVFSEWKQTFLGHYHAPQVLTKKGNVEYVGSPLELSYGEAYQDKHIIVFDMDTFKKTYIDNDFSPKHLMVAAEKIHEQDLTNNFVRVVIEDMSSQELIDLRKELSDKNVAEITFKAKEKKKEDSQTLEDAKAILYKSEEMLEQYVSNTGVPESLDKKNLLSIGQSIVQKGNEENE